MLYDDFKPIVDIVLNNWTALQLAVEHGMGSPGGKETAQLLSVYVTRYCVENIVDRDDLIEVLEDLMDEEFETVCHDESPKEVATLLLEFLDLLKSGQHDALRVRMDALPKCQIWLSQPVIKTKPQQCHGNPDDNTSSSDDDEECPNLVAPTQQMNQENGHSSQTERPPDEPMDEDPDPGWTVVRTRRKK